METDFRPVNGHPRPTFIGPKSGHLVNLDPRIEKRDLQIANTDRITGCTLNLLLNFRLERLPNARCIDGKDDTRQDASQNTKRYDDIALHALAIPSAPKGAEEWFAPEGVELYR